MRIDYYEVQVNGKFLFNLNQIVSLSWLYFVKSNCFVLQIELSIYVGFCLLSKSISSDELGIYTHSFSWLIFMMIKTVGEVQTEMLVLQIFHPKQHLLWHKAGGKPAIVDHNFA